MTPAEQAEIERAEGIAEDRWFQHGEPELGFDLDDLFAEDQAAIDFASEPQPLDGLDAIDRRLATLRQAQRKLNEYDRISEARRAELEQRITEGRRSLVERVGYLTRSLQISHQAIVAEDPRRTRIDLVNGTLTSKAQGVEWVWPQPDTPAEGELLSWVREHQDDAYVPPSYVPVPARVAKVPLKAALKDAATKKVDGVTVPASDDGTVLVDGVAVPGLVVKAKPREFTPIPAGLDDEGPF